MIGHPSTVADACYKGVKKFGVSLNMDLRRAYEDELGLWAAKTESALKARAANQYRNLMFSRVVQRPDYCN